MYEKIFKKIFALILVIIMVSSCAFASSNENDGSSFITKAEFDSLKSNFQSQLDSYNMSIDSKIDQAISAYLSAIVNIKESEKPLIISNYDTVGLYEADDMVYEYSRPEIHTYVIGMEASNITTGMCGSGNTNLTGYFNMKVDYEPVAGSYFGKEISISNNSKATPKYVWNSYDTNVYRLFTNTTLLNTIPTDGSYGSIRWTQATFAFNNFTAGKYLTNLNDEYLIKGAIWSYNGSTAPRKNAADFYGPCQYNSYTSSKTNSITVEYRDDDRTVNEKWKNRYIISYSKSSKPCNLYNDVKQIGVNVTGAITETQKDVNQAVTFSGTEHLDWKGGSSVYHQPAIARYNLSVTSPNTYMDLTDNVPVFGGLGLVSSNDIRQKEDNLKSDDVKGVVISDINLNAGFPLFIEKKDGEITYDIAFEDTSSDYKVWLSYVPFDTTSADGAPTDSGINNVKFNDGNRYAIVKNGIGTLKWTMEKDSAVYLKWAKCDSTGTVTDMKNGVLNLKKCNKYKARNKV